MISQQVLWLCSRDSSAICCDLDKHSSVSAGHISVCGNQQGSPYCCLCDFLPFESDCLNLPHIVILSGFPLRQTLDCLKPRHSPRQCFVRKQTNELLEFNGSYILRDLIQWKRTLVHTTNWITLLCKQKNTFFQCISYKRG